MIENIKDLYRSLNKENKEKVAKAIEDKFHLSDVTVKQHYLTSFNIKETRQEPIIKMLQLAHFEQSKQSKKLANEIL